MRFSRRTSAGLVAVALGLLVLALSGCSTGQAGASALIGDQRISESELNKQVQELLAAQGLTAQDSSSELVIQTLNRLIITALVDQLADREGVQVDQGEIDAIRLQYEAQLGGESQLEEQVLGEGVLPSDIDSVIKVNVQVSKLGQKLAPTDDPGVQTQAVFVAMTELSTEINTEVAPRYGTWDAENLTIGPEANSVSEPLDVELGQE